MFLLLSLLLFHSSKTRQASKFVNYSRSIENSRHSQAVTLLMPTLALVPRRQRRVRFSKGNCLCNLATGVQLLPQMDIVSLLFFSVRSFVRSFFLSTCLPNILFANVPKFSTSATINITSTSDQRAFNLIGTSAHCTPPALSGCNQVAQTACLLGPTTTVGWSTECT